MALRHMEGFETRQHLDYFTRLYNSTATTGAITAFDTGRKLGFSARATNFVFRTEPLVPSVENTWILAFGYKMESASTPAFAIKDAAGTTQLRLRWAAGTTANTFTIAVVRGATTLATSQEFQLGQWHFFEFKATIRTSTNGSYELRHNEAVVLSASGVNTADTGADGASVFEWNFGGSGIGFANLDDIVIMDNTGSAFNDYLGDKAIVGILPTTAGASTQWQPSAGTNVQCVDDPASGPNADFVSSNVLNDLDLYEFGNTTQVASDGTVDAVMVCCSAEMLNAGGRGLKIRFRNSGAATGDGPQFDVTLKGTIRTFPVIFEEDPAAVGAWTKAALDGGQFGILNFAEL